MSRVLLTNIPEVDGNPWLGSWLAAEASQGLDVQKLTLARTLARDDASPVGAHLQWPEFVLNTASWRSGLRSMVALLVKCAILRVRGRRVVLTVHNLRSHERRRPRMETVLWWWVTRLATDTHLLSAASAPEVLAVHPALRRTMVHVIPHGDFADLASRSPSREHARQSLSIPVDCRLLLSYGYLRAYKGTLDLMQVFSSETSPDQRLLVVGRSWPEDVASLEAGAVGDSRIELRIGYVPDADLLTMIAAADLIVQPFRRVLNSSTVMLALSCGRRVLVPSTPVFEELAERVGDGWVLCYRGALDGAMIQAALAQQVSGTPDLSWCTWPEVQRGIAKMWSDTPCVREPGTTWTEAVRPDRRAHA